MTEENNPQSCVNMALWYMTHGKEEDAKHLVQSFLSAHPKRTLFEALKARADANAFEVLGWSIEPNEERGVTRQMIAEKQGALKAERRFIGRILRIAQPDLEQKSHTNKRTSVLSKMSKPHSSLKSLITRLLNHIRKKLPASRNR